jgi:hypothetical protein
VKYDIKPSFKFDDNDAVSLRTRSKTGNKAPVTSAIHAVLGERKSSVQTVTAPPLRTTFWKLLEQIMPHDLHTRLASGPGYCVASLVKDPCGRCTSTKGSFCDVGSILKNLVKSGTRQDYCGMLDHIEELVKSVMCGTHRNTVLNQLKAGSTLRQWADTICDLDVPIDQVPDLPTVETDPKPAAQPEPISEPVSKASPATTTLQASCSSKFIPYQSEKSKKLSVHDAVYQKATAPLGVIAQKEGFVYLFWDKEYFGMVKIGYTKDLTKRLNSWNKQCDREHVYHSSTECQVEIPHAHRVEQLVHAELKEYRKRRLCEGCGVIHKEWFGAPQAHVVKVLRKWREWILEEPYAQDKKSGEWVLKPEMLESLERMCEPLPHEVSIQKPRRKSSGLQRAHKKKMGARRTT